MPRFTVLITRDVTESNSVTVEAADAEAAASAAFAALSASRDAIWTLDEGSWNKGDPYITARDALGECGCPDRGLSVRPPSQSPLVGI